MCNLFRSDPHTTLRLKIQLFASNASIAQLGERQTEDLKVPGSIPGGGNFLFLNLVTVRVGVRVRGRIGVSVRVRARIGVRVRVRARNWVRVRVRARIWVRVRVRARIWVRTSVGVRVRVRIRARVGVGITAQYGAQSYVIFFHITFKQKLSILFIIRSYHPGYTGSHLNSEVKQDWAYLVLW